MLKLAQNRHGFTLLEIMMVTGIIGIFIMIIYKYMNYNIDFLYGANQESSSSLQARIAMQKITRDFEKYQSLQILEYSSGQPVPIYTMSGTNNPSPPLYVICSGADKLINCMNESYGDLAKSGEVVAKNLKVAVIYANDVNPLDSSYVTIKIEGYPDDDFTGATVSLSTIMRLDRKRYGL